MFAFMLIVGYNMNVACGRFCSVSFQYLRYADVELILMMLINSVFLHIRKYRIFIL